MTSVGIYSGQFTELISSIEANTIIIAACVPTMTPLIELILGRKIFSTRSARQSSAYVQSSSLVKGKSSSGPGSRVHQSRSSHQWTTVQIENGVSGDDVESQKSILGRGEDNIPLDRIARTDHVIIEYEAADDRPRPTWIPPRGNE